MDKTMMNRQYVRYDNKYSNHSPCNRPAPVSEKNQRESII